ncbi:Holliday junction DNA helicase RuvA [Elusimicrobium posterum]|uniref:Holliday junction branch migration protein RuvA n=1 Tax=Elusimicrobium posterum TaxID=3116653 RepID=UPI003C727B8D
MIAYLKGQVFSVAEDHIILLTSGVGYQVNLASSSIAGLEEGQSVEMYIAESISPYDGTMLYGFLSKQDKALWQMFRDSIPNTGAKKALDYLNKALRSVADFHRAIVNKDPKILTGIFGFTNKTAEKLITSLKDKMDAVSIQGLPKIHVEGDALYMSEVMSALSALGYNALESRKALDQIYRENGPENNSVEAVLRSALRILKR